MVLDAVHGGHGGGGHRGGLVGVVDAADAVDDVGGVGVLDVLLGGVEDVVVGGGLDVVLGLHVRQLEPEGAQKCTQVGTVLFVPGVRFFSILRSGDLFKIIPLDCVSP